MKSPLFLLLISIIVSGFSCSQKTNNSLDKVMGQAVITVEPDSLILTDDFKQMLREELDNVRFVALGEASHEDGATFRHKIELVKFLHQELGYNVLAMEYALYGNYLRNKALSGDADYLDAARGAGWIMYEESAPLYKYIQESHASGNPLNLAGFDTEKVPMGIPNIKKLFSELTAIPDFDFSEDEFSATDSLIDAVHGRLGNATANTISFATRNKAKETITELIDFLEVNRNNFSALWGHDEFVMRKLALESLLMSEKETFAGAFKNIVRDHHMADRLFWLADSLYPNEKFILWGATSHFVHDAKLLDRHTEENEYGYYPYYYMGDFVHARYKDAYYIIGFSATSGKSGTIYPDNHPFKKYEQFYEIEAGNTPGFEQKISNIESQSLFTSLRTVDPDFRFTAHPLGYRQDTGPWAKVLDAFYTIKSMEPVTLIPR